MYGLELLIKWQFIVLQTATATDTSLILVGFAEAKTKCVLCFETPKPELFSAIAVTTI